MRLLYTKYYKGLKRGFTEQEFKDACEKVAGISLQEVFEYASTVKPPNYPKYFAWAGLTIDTMPKAKGAIEKTFTIRRIPNPDKLQAAIYKSWMGE